MPDDPRRNTETPTTRANKASAMRWAVGIAILFIAGVIAWWVSGIPRGDAPDLTPQNQSEETQPWAEDGTQPPAVIPRDDPEPEGAIPLQPYKE